MLNQDTQTTAAGSGSVGAKDFSERQNEWWDSLTASQRFAASRVVASVPIWMVDSLSNFGITSVEADLAGHSRVFLMATRLREFIAEQADSSDGE